MKISTDTSMLQFSIESTVLRISLMAMCRYSIVSLSLILREARVSSSVSRINLDNSLQPSTFATNMLRSTAWSWNIFAGTMMVRFVPICDMNSALDFLHVAILASAI